MIQPSPPASLVICNVVVTVALMSCARFFFFAQKSPVAFAWFPRKKRSSLSSRGLWDSLDCREGHETGTEAPKTCQWIVPLSESWQNITVLVPYPFPKVFPKTYFNCFLASYAIIQYQSGKTNASGVSPLHITDPGSLSETGYLSDRRCAPRVSTLGNTALLLCL